MNRREFILGGAMTAAAFAQNAKAAPLFCRVAFLSDLHLDGIQPEAHQNALVRRTVEALLKLSPRPSRVVVCGDLALHAGRPEDYALAVEVLRPLKKVGISVEVMAGNHDSRRNLAAAFPDCASDEVPGRIVRALDLGPAELLLLDSLDEGRVDGAIDAEQERWLLAHLDRAAKPVFLCAHHDGRQMKAFAASALTRSAVVIGYIHGHRHEWLVDALHGWKGPAGPRFVRSVGLPSAGFWGDIGFAVLDVRATEACLTLHETDCFFPAPSARTMATFQMRRENDCARVVFPYMLNQGGALPLSKPVAEERTEGPLCLYFTGTGGADWRDSSAPQGEHRAFTSLLLDDRVLIDWHGSARRNLPDSVKPAAIVYTHSHGDHFSPADALSLGSVRRVYVSRSWHDVAAGCFSAAAKTVGIVPPEVVAVDLYESFLVEGLIFRALPANHTSGNRAEQCVIYQIQKKGKEGHSGVNLLYATDTGGLMKAAVDNLEGTLNAIIMNAMIGPGQRSNRRIFSHCTIEQVAETVAALVLTGKYVPPKGRPVWTTHLSRVLNGTREELEKSYPKEIVPAYDGLTLMLETS